MITTIIVLMFLLGLGFLLYEQCSVQIIAEDAATKVAQTYKLLESDTATGDIGLDEINEIPLYRYDQLFGGDTFESENRKKTRSYAGLRLSKTSLANKSQSLSVEFTVEPNGNSRRHVVVAVATEYEIPFGNFLSLIGFDSVQNYQATASAECVDILDYYARISFASRIANYPEKSKVVKTISSLMKVIFHEYD
jgi:hypothetical protein